MNKSIDLNCDMGEGLDNDTLLMPLISSANIACGFHAGNEDIMKRTIELSVINNVAIGAHPGFKDQANFGRTEMVLSEQELFDLMTEQIYLLQKIAAIFGEKIHHIKPHGALYNMAARDGNMARTIVESIKSVDASYILYGLSGSKLISEAAAVGLSTASETFADRTYQKDGSLTARTLPGAMIEKTEDSLQQVLQMIRDKSVTTIDGITIPIKADTICIHGDGKQAVAFAALIRKNLLVNQITIQTI
jgi:UPF0271 protein